MKKLNRKLRKGHTLQRVNTIREQLAHQRAVKAQVNMSERKQVEETRRTELLDFDAQLHSAAGDGISMRSFLRLQGMREMHVAALNQATSERVSASNVAEQENQALRAAVAKRRTADHLVSVIASKRAVAQKSIEQKQSDDLTCARYSHGHASLIKAA